MDRFDSNFHDTDPITHRPFSAGHPDGVWIIGILCSFAVGAGALLMIAAILQIAFGKGGSYENIVVGGGLVILFLPFILLLAKRSAKTIPYAVVLTVISAAGAVLNLQAGGIVLWVLSGAAIVQLGFVAYLIGLKRDSLLK